MIESEYEVYGEGNRTIKRGIVKHQEDIPDDPRGPVNFFEAVVADVGEEAFEKYVIGIRDHSSPAVIMDNGFNIKLTPCNR